MYIKFIVHSSIQKNELISVHCINQIYFVQDIWLVVRTAFF